MRRKILRLITIVVCGLCAVGQVQAAQTVKGTVQSGTHEAIVMITDISHKQQTIKPAAGAVMLRGQMGKQLRKASLLDLAPGDRVIAVVKQDGAASSIKAFYAVVRGTVIKVQNEKIILRDGTSVALKPGVGVVFGGGRIGKPTQLKPGTMILCRLNPSTRQAWTIVATEPAAVEPVKPIVKPVVSAITYAGPSPLKVRDWVRVDLEGTSGGRATCQVNGLIPVTVMKEIEPGMYRAQVMIPSGKPVTDAALVGRISIGTSEAEPVQAAKLITVGPMTLPTPESQPTATAAESTPPATVAEVPVEPVRPEAPPAPVTPPPAPVEPPKPEPPKIKAPVVLTAPANAAKITRSFMISGTADPGSQVMVKVTFSNSLDGILNLSGQISSQLLAADDKGQFAMGPIPLEGPLATQGLLFTVEAFYPDSNGQGIAAVTIFGDRS